MPKAVIEALDFFAGDETVKLALTDRVWVELKRALDYGESAELEGSLFRGVSTEEIRGAAASDGQLRVTDWAKYKVLRIALYLTDWNLPGANGATVRLPGKLDERMKIVRKLSPKWADKIIEKIDELEAEAKAEVEAEDGDDPKPSGEPEEPGSKS